MKMYLNPDLILVTIKQLDPDAYRSSGGIIKPAYAKTSKYNGPVKLESKEYAHYIEIVDVGDNLKEIKDANGQARYRPGLRVKLLPPHFEHFPRLNAEEYSSGTDSNLYGFIEPQIIACLIEYETPEEKPYKEPELVNQKLKLEAIGAN